MRTRPLPHLMLRVVGSPASTIPGKNALGSLNSLFLGILKSVKTPKMTRNRMTRFQRSSFAVVTLLSRYVCEAFSLASVSRGPRLRIHTIQTKQSFCSLRAFSPPSSISPLQLDRSISTPYLRMPPSTMHLEHPNPSYMPFVFLGTKTFCPALQLLSAKL